MLRGAFHETYGTTAAVQKDSLPFLFFFISISFTITKRTSSLYDIQDKQP